MGGAWHSSCPSLDLPSRSGFLGAELRNALDQLHWNGLGERESDGTLRNFVGCKFVLERRHQAIACWIERVVLLPPGQIKHRAAVPFLAWDLIRNHFFSARQRFADNAPHAFEYGLHLLV